MQTTSATTNPTTGAQALDSSEAECIRLAREDLRTKMAAKSPPPDPSVHVDNVINDDVGVGIRLAREDLRTKLALNGAPDGDLPVPDDTEVGIRLAREDLQGKLDSSRILMESRESSTMMKVAKDEITHPVPSTSRARVEETPENVLGAVAVSSSQNMQRLHPVNPTSFNSSGEPQPAVVTHGSNNTADEPLLEATLVEEGGGQDDDNNDSHRAKVVSAEELVCGFSTRQWYYLGGCLGLLAAIIAVAVIVLWRSSSSSGTNPSENASAGGSSGPKPPALPTLQQIRQRDVLRCGIWQESLDFFNFAGIYENPDDQVDVVLCKAYAAAVLGDAHKFQIVLTGRENNLLQLAEGKIDLLITHVETGMQADVWEQGLEQGFAFSVPYLYTDFVCGGLPEYVACADDRMNAQGNCSGLLICTNDKSVYFETISSSLPESHLVKRNDTLDIVMGFVNGDCNVIPSENSGIMEWGLELLAYQGSYIRGIQPFVRDVVTVATRDDDVEFSDFVNMILLGLLAAEQANVTQDMADQMLDSAVLGEELTQVVAAVGNYNDVYQRGVAPVMKRGVWNHLNDGTTGLMYSLPLGKVRTIGSGPVPNGTLEQIWKRPNRKLHCGIRANRPGFASLDETGELVGMDIEYCTALAASVLEGEAQAIDFIPMDNETDGYQRLYAGEVDVLAGFTWTAINDYQEPTTGIGYSFSPPYFYAPLDDDFPGNSSIVLEPEEDNLALVTRQDDVQFSSFVYWTVTATIYASEQGITRSTANDMPDVNLFGDEFSKMFRDAIYFAGSYDEIYERNLGERLPAQRGRNAINSIKEPGPQLYVPPGFLA